MISIVCVYNNEKILNNVLLKGLEHQSVEFELITLDNRNNRFKSAAQALNYGGVKAKGDYIAFVHQDMLFIDESWLENTETMLASLPDLGVAGVMGVSEGTGILQARVKNSTSFFDMDWGLPAIERIEEVQTLDECVLIVPKSVFSELKFDEEVFDGWDCYGADYCLAVRGMGKRVYVIPGDCRHCCLREHFKVWEFEELHKYRKRLYAKYKNEHKIIHTWMGELSWQKLRSNELMALIGPIYLNLFSGFNRAVAKELSGCESVLDLGCGPASPISSLGIPYSVGVELSEPLLEESKRLDIHSEYIIADIRHLEFEENSFDAVIALNVLEYLPKQEGIELIAKMRKWARKSVLIRTPNIPLNDNSRDRINQRQARETAWKADEFVELGLRVRGLGGWRKLKPEANYFQTLLVAISQKIVLRFPRQAVHLFVSWRSGYVEG